jgi:hypothetical protein
VLPSHDVEYLNAKARGHQIATEGGVICVLVPSYPLPKGFDRRLAISFYVWLQVIPTCRPICGGSIPLFAERTAPKSQLHRPAMDILGASGSAGRDISRRANGTRGSTHFKATLP